MGTNSDLVAYCKKAVADKACYWYGTYMNRATKQLFNAKREQYPQYYPPQSWTEESFTSQFGRRCTDCAGMIKAAIWSGFDYNKIPSYHSSSDYGANGFYTAAKKKGKISSFDKVNGRLVFKANSSGKMHHVGVYCADDDCVYEAKGHAYGVIKSKFNGSWTHWAQCHLISEDSPSPAPTPTPTPTGDTYPGPWPELPARGFFRRGDYNSPEVVKLQDFLNWWKPGCLDNCGGSDGDYGKGTAAQVAAFQASAHIENDGEWGPITQRAAQNYSKSMTYRVDTQNDPLRLRSAPNTSSPTLTRIPKGTAITVNGIVSGESIHGDTQWMHTSYNGHSGYAAGYYLTRI